jgi:hypothetical protein
MYVGAGHGFSRFHYCDVAQLQNKVVKSIGGSYQISIARPNRKFISGDG